MKLHHFLLLASIFLLSACDMQKRKEALEAKAAELSQKEQSILAREQLLEQKEQEYLLRKQAFDSVANKLQDSSRNQHIMDSLFLANPGVPGMYSVTMKCTETNCVGYAVGDTKNEQWNIAFEQSAVMIRAMSDNKLVRIYKGNFIGGGIELEAQPDSATTLAAGKITVRLQENKDKRLKGIREITGQDDCRVIYDLDMKKQ